jgi:hypothetical protein
VSRKPKPDPAPRRRPVRTFVAKLEGEYEGTEAVMIANPPLRVLDQLSNPADFNDLDKVRSAVAGLTASWNFVDGNGDPVPLDDTCSGLTADEVYYLLNAYYVGRREANGLPKESAEPSESTTPSST